MYDGAVDSSPKPLGQLKGIAPIALLPGSMRLQANFVRMHNDRP
jgi:hypothetical protein